MKIFRMILISASVFLLYRCNAILNEIKSSFETVNNSLENSNRYAGAELKYIYSHIDSNRINNPELSRKADSVFYIVQDTYEYIENFKRVMISVDSSGTQIWPSDKLIVNSPNGDTLAERLVSVSSQCYSGLVDGSALLALNTTLKDINQFKINKKKWPNTYFHSTPTIGVVTILSKFQNDCKEAGIIVLTHLKNHLSN